MRVTWGPGLVSMRITWGPMAGEHEGHMGPRAGEHESHIGPRAGTSIQVRYPMGGVDRVRMHVRTCAWMHVRTHVCMYTYPMGDEDRMRPQLSVKPAAARI